MTTTTSGFGDAPVTRVVAGLADDSDVTDAIARVAATEAARRRVPLEFVHVVDETRSWRDARHDPVLRRGLLALPLRSQPRPVLRLFASRPEQVLLRLTSSSDLLVVGTGRVHGTFGALAGSDCMRILRRSTAPVLVVPGVPAEQPARSTWPVVAAVALDGDEEAVVTAGFAAAVERHVPLRVIHSRRPGDLAFDAGTAETWIDIESRAYVAIDRVIARVIPRFPEVTVTVTVAATAPADLLTRATKNASLLVVGAPRHAGAITPAHHVTRSVLRHAQTTVLSVPVDAARPNAQPLSRRTSEPARSRHLTPVAFGARPHVHTP